MTDVNEMKSVSAMTQRAKRPVSGNPETDRRTATTILGNGLNGGKAGMTEGEVRLEYVDRTIEALKRYAKV